MFSKMTGKEKDVLELLIKSDQSLTATEIVDLDTRLNINTVQSVLRSLLKKELIKIAEIVYSGKVLCRSYEPTPLARESSLKAFTHQYNSLKRSIPIPRIFSALIDDDIDDMAIIDELEGMLAQKKEQLNKEE